MVFKLLRYTNLSAMFTVQRTDYFFHRCCQYVLAMKKKWGWPHFWRQAFSRVENYILLVSASQTFGLVLLCYF